MAVATYSFYEKVRWTIRTTNILHLFNVCTFRIKSNWKLFDLQEWHQNTKAFISYKTFTVKKKLKPGKNDQIWLVVAWYRFFIRRPPFQDDHFWVVPRVVVLYRFDCITKNTITFAKIKPIICRVILCSFKKIWSKNIL